MSELQVVLLQFIQLKERELSEFISRNRHNDTESVQWKVQYQRAFIDDLRDLFRADEGGEGSDEVS